MKKRSTVYFALAAAIFLATCTQLGQTAIDPPGTYLSRALFNGTTVQRWNDTTRVLAINIQPGSNIPGWTPAKIQLVKSAFSEWQSALGGRLKFTYTPDMSQSDVIVKWGARPQGNQIGHQSINWTNNLLTDAFINVDMMTPFGQPMTDDELRVTTLHEIGHLLGIRGHSVVASDVMFPTLQHNVRHLSSRDIATARALYRLKPSITNPLGIHLMAYKQFLYYKGLALNAFNQKDYSGAYQYFHKAQGYYAHDPGLYYCLGICAYNAHHYDQAIPDLSKAVGIADNNQSQATYFLASALSASASHDVIGGRKAQGKTKLEQARQYYTHVLKNPVSPLALKQAATSQIAQINKVAAEIH